MAAVRARGITKRFETTVALDAVDLDVSEGEVRGLLGPNGAGKTTLLRILFGLVAPDGGSVELFDRRRSDPEQPQLDGVAGFVEDPSFYPYLSGRANLELLARLDGGEHQDRIDAGLKRVGLAGRADDRVNGYSTGMKQRLGIAAALLRAPRLLLLDEPTAGLDPAGVRQIGELVRELSADGVAILVSSHQIAEVEGVCDGFTFIRRGQVVWDGSNTELLAEAPASSYAISTSDDSRAIQIAQRSDGVQAGPADHDGLELTVQTGRLDPYVLALGHDGVAIRRLELRVSPLESMFFKLTGGRDLSRDGVLRVYAIERRKLGSQLAIRLLALVCVLTPFVGGALIKITGSSPSDTLYGVWVRSSGFALSLFILAFVGSWGFPLIAGIVGGDLFSSEDRYGTWKLVLTRSCTRAELFAGKLLAAATFVTGLTGLTAVSTVIAGAVLVGPHSLVSLSGTPISAGKALLLVAVSWLLCLLPTLAFTSLAALLSVATRNGIAGVVGPLLAALAMQLLLLVGSGVWAHMLLVASAFTTWHPLFLDHPYYGALAIGIGISVVWTAGCAGAAWLILRRRDFAGTPATRRVGWVAPARAAVALAAVIALFALAGNWGPVGVTPARLKTSFIPAFSKLTILQQQQLGRTVPPGATLNIALPSCSRRGSGPDGPGDWVCTINVVIPTPGSLPPQPTPVSYDISVQSDGCYKAQSPPVFIGQQLMRDAGGNQVVNPLYTIYGCFNTL